jgi:hypothetical protein
VCGGTLITTRSSCDRNQIHVRRFNTASLLDDRYPCVLFPLRQLPSSSSATMRHPRACVYFLKSLWSLILKPSGSPQCHYEEDSFGVIQSSLQSSLNISLQLWSYKPEVETCMSIVRRNQRNDSSQKLSARPTSSGVKQSPTNFSLDGCTSTIQ